jgi:hypothetical protein
MPGWRRPPIAKHCKRLCLCGNRGYEAGKRKITVPFVFIARVSQKDKILQNIEISPSFHRNEPAGIHIFEKIFLRFFDLEATEYASYPAKAGNFYGVSLLRQKTQLNERSFSA